MIERRFGVYRVSRVAQVRKSEDASSELGVIVINFIGTWKLRCGLVGTRLRAGHGVWMRGVILSAYIL